MSKRDEQRTKMAATFQNRRKTEEFAPNSRPRAPRVKPVRITVDLEPTQHRDLKRWCLDADDARIADVVRVLLDRLTADDALADAVRADLRNAVSQ